MARMIKCDSCKTPFDYNHEDKSNSKNLNAIGLLDKDFNSKYYTRKIYDLCPTCIKNIVNLLDLKEFKDE